MEKLILRLESNDPNTTSVRLDGRTLPDSEGDDDIISKLADAMTNNSFVQDVSLQNVPATQAFLRALQTLQHLTSLTLSGSHLTASTIRLACDIPSYATLQTLNLSDNAKIGPRGCKQLAELVAKCQTLRVLNLSTVGMGHFGAQAFAAHLPTTLEELNLSHNKLGHDGLWKLAEHLPSTLKTLDLSYNKCLDDGCLEIAKHLPRMKQLARLDLAGNDIADTGVQLLAKSLVGSNVEQLFLQENKITDEGATALAKEALALSEAELSDENSSDEEEEEFEEENQSESGHLNLSPRSNISLINLASNVLGSAGCSALAQALSQGCNVVHWLDLSKNQIGDEGAGSFVELIDEIPSLVSLNLSENPFSEARTRILDMLLKHRTPRHQSNQNEGSFRDFSEHSASKSHQADGSSSSTQQEQSIEESSKQVHDIEQAREKLNKALTNDSIEGGLVCELPDSYCAHTTETFQAQRILTYGAFGPLYSASDSKLATRCLVCRKMDLGPAGQMKAVREAVLTEVFRLRHVHVLPVVSFSRIGPSSCAFIYDVGEMRSVADILRDETCRKKLTWKMRADILYRVSLALEYFHSDAVGHKAMFHGDVRPHNVFVSPDFGSTKLIDGGLSRVLATDRSRFAPGDVVFGSRAYRCPRYERGSCQYDWASDIFSFGVLAGEVVAGKLQNSKSETGMAWDIYYDIVLSRHQLKIDPLIPFVPAISDPVCRIMAMCLAPTVSKRPRAEHIVQMIKQLV